MGVPKMTRITTHPGEILKYEFMEPLGLSARALAADLGVPANRITTIIRGTRSVTADTAIKLGKRFGTTPELWMNLQQAHDLSKAFAGIEKTNKHSQNASNAANRTRRPKAA